MSDTRWKLHNSSSLSYRRDYNKYVVRPLVVVVIIIIIIEAIVVVLFGSVGDSVGPV